MSIPKQDSLAYWLPKYPLLWAAIPMVLGVFIGKYVSIPLLLVGLIVSISFVGMLFAKQSKLFTAFAAVFFIVLGCWLSGSKINSLNVKLPDEKGVFELQITDVPLYKSSSVSFDALWIDFVYSYHLRITLQVDSSADSLCIGDRLLVRGVITKPHPLNPYAFDYGWYLTTQGYVGTIYSSQWKKIGHSTDVISIRQWGNIQQKRVADFYEKCGIHGQELAVLSALTIGDREQLDQETRHAYSAAGAMHILAVSGLHVGIIYAILIFIVTFGGVLKPLRRQQWLQILQSAIIICALWIYAIITGLSPSVVRAVLMFSLGEIGRSMHKTDFGLNVVGASALISLLINPLAVFSISFQLSYCAVIAIMTIGQKLDRFCCSWLKYVKPKNKFINFLKKVIRYVIGILTISTAAQLGTAPLSIYYFHQFSTYFLLTNLVLLPYVYVAFCSLLFICIPIVPQTVFMLLNKYVMWIEQLPYSTIALSLNAIEVILIFGILIAGNKQKLHYIAALLIICFVGYYVYHQCECRSLRQTIIYASRNVDAIQIIDKGNNVVLTNDSLNALTLTQDITLNYSLDEPHIMPLQYAYHSDELGEIIIINDSLFQGKEVDAPIECDILLLGNIGHVGAERIMKQFIPTRVILLGTMKWRKREHISLYCKENNIDCYDLMTQGAWIR